MHRRRRRRGRRPARRRRGRRRCRPRASTASTPTARSALLREQVAVGQRPAGSARSCARWPTRLRALLPDGRFEAVPGPSRACATSSACCPGREPAIVVGAHYDTRGRAARLRRRQRRRRGHRGGRRAGPHAGGAPRPGERPRGALRAVRRRGGAARLDRLRAPMRCAARRPTPRAHAREVALDDPARLRRQQGPAAPARGQLGHRRSGRGCAPRPGASACRRVFPATTRWGSSTTTRRSSTPASRRSTSSTSPTATGHRRATRSTSSRARSLDAVGETVLELVREQRAR